MQAPRLVKTSTILKQFASSREGRALPLGTGWSRTLVDFARERLGRNIPEIGGAQLEEILFRVFPQQVMCGPSEARSIVVELRAFFRFLKREHGFDSADDCLGVLNASAERRLQRLLIHPAAFGTAKVFFLSASEGS